jgi:putative ABC transport system permease protein
MALLRRLIAGFRGLFQNTRTEREMDDELRGYLDAAAEQKMRSGLSREDAIRAARVETGSVEALKDGIRDVGWESAIETCWQDLRYAIRTLRNSPGFSAVAVLTMALGIGAAAVIFSVVYNVLVDPLPYKDFRRSVVFRVRGLTDAGGWRGRSWFSIQEFLAFREQNHVFEDLIGFSQNRVLHDDGRSTRLFRGAYVTANTFDFLGIPPLLGRSFTADDGRPGALPVFAMNHRLWQSDFGSDPGIVGRTFLLDGEPTTLIGIMPLRFNAFSADIWLAHRLDWGVLAPMGRLKPGITVEAAAKELDLIAHRFARENPGGSNPEQFAIDARTFLDSLLGDFRGTLQGLLAAVLLLLLIACSNVANLMLARATSREREIAMRAAIGATRGRLIRQLLLESLVLAAAAAISGCAVGYLGLKIVAALIPPGSIPAETAIEMSAPVLLLSLGLAVLTMLLCGLAPALHLVRGDLQPRLAGRSRGGGIRHSRLRTALVVTEVALSIFLLIGAGLMLRSFVVLTRVDLGFNPTNILYVRPWFPREYDTADKKNAFTRQLLQRMRALPGVTAVAESMLVPPLTHDWSDTIVPGKPHSERWESRFELCSEGYFQTIGLPLLRGTLFSEADVAAKRFVTVVNQTFVRRYFSNEEPLGKRVKFQVFDRPFLDAPHDTYFEIVGVVADHKTWAGEWQNAPQAFLPYSVQGFSFRTFLARTSLDSDALVKSAREAVWAIDPRVGISASGSIEQSLRDFYRDPQFDLVTLGAFAGIGLALVASGVFSVMAYTVSLRTHEIGVRMALGARQPHILRMVLLQGVGLVAAGGSAGLVAAYAFSGVLPGGMSGVSATDPVTFVVVPVVVGAVGLMACLLPARRASRVDPLLALRSE